MELVNAVLLGVLQGIFEWLPVSSEAVTTLVMTQFLGQEPINAVNTAIYLHSGTMLAALLYFRGDFLEMFRRIPGYVRETVDQPSKLKQPGLMNFLVVSTFVSSALGGTLYVFGTGSLPSNPDIFAGLVGVALLATGLMKLLGEGAGRAYRDADLNDSLLVGALQGLAIIPGISRSGSTIFGLFYRDFSSDDAFKLSFLMSVPAIFIAQIGLNLFSGFTVNAEMIIAAASAFLAGYVSIGAVLEVARRIEVGYIAVVLALLSFLPLLI